MMNSKKIFLYIILFVIMYLVIPRNSFAQIGGISGSKLYVPDAETVPSGRFEFEPSISLFRYSKKYDALGYAKSLNGFNENSSLQFRVTLGLNQNIEFGTSFSTDLDGISLGSKLKLFSSDWSSLAIIGGILLPAGNYSSDDSLTSSYDVHSIAIGSSFSIQLAERSSVDINVIYSRLWDSGKYSNEINYGISLGYYIVHGIQGVLELDGYSCFRGGLSAMKISLVPGVTYTFSDNLIIVLSEQFDVAGKNDFCGINTSCAFTMSF